MLPDRESCIIILGIEEGGALSKEESEEVTIRIKKVKEKEIKNSL